MGEGGGGMKSVGRKKEGKKGIKKVERRKRV